MPSARRRLAVVLSITLLGLAACGGGDDASSATSAPAVPDEPVLQVPEEPVDPVAEGTIVVSAGESIGVDLEELATSIELRLSAAGHPAAVAQVIDGDVQVDPGSGPLDAAAVEELLAEPGRLEIRPVRAQPGRRQCGEAGPQGVGQDSVYPEYGEDDEAGDIVACYTLAPGGVTNDDIDSAFARRIGDGDEDWAVDLVLTFDGIDAFNRMALACKNRRAPCNRGLAAIALDRVVVSSPRVKDAHFQRNDIQITGDMDEEDANSLAAALTTEPLPRGLEFSR